MTYNQVRKSGYTFVLSLALITRFTVHMQPVSPAPYDACAAKKPSGFVVIATFKLLYGVALAAAGFGIFHLINRDIGNVVEDFILHLHLDPGRKYVTEIASRLVGISPRQLKEIGFGTFFFAGLDFVEGAGLLFRKHWAEYLTVFGTALLLPLELYELIEKFTWLRVAVLVINTAIVIYLVFQLKRERQCRIAVSDQAHVST